MDANVEISNVVWTPLSLLVPETLFSESNEIVKGKESTNLFVACVKLLSSRRPMITQLEEKGKYAVSLFLNGKKEEIVIDDEVPCDPESKTVLYSYEKSSMWVSLLEKAVAKVHASETFYKPTETIPLEILKHLIQVTTGVSGVMHDGPKSPDECQHFADTIREMLSHDEVVVGFSKEYGLFQITKVDDSTLFVKSLYYDSEHNININSLCEMIKTVVSFQLAELSQQSSTFCYSASASRCVVRLVAAKDIAVGISVFASTPQDVIPPMRFCVVDQKGNPVGGTQKTFYPASPVCSKVTLTKGVAYKLLVEVPEESFVPYNATVCFAYSGDGALIKASLDEAETDLYFVLPAFHELFGDCARCGITLPCRYASVGGKGYHLSCCVCSVCGCKLEGQAKLVSGALRCLSCVGKHKTPSHLGPKASPLKTSKRSTAASSCTSNAAQFSATDSKRVPMTSPKKQKSAEVPKSSPKAKTTTGKRASSKAAEGNEKDGQHPSLSGDKGISSESSEMESVQPKLKTPTKAASHTSAKRSTTSTLSSSSPAKSPRKATGTMANVSPANHSSAAKGSSKVSVATTLSNSPSNAQGKRKAKVNVSLSATHQSLGGDLASRSCNSSSEQREHVANLSISEDSGAAVGDKVVDGVSQKIIRRAFVPEAGKDQFTYDAIAKLWKELLESADNTADSFYHKALPISTVHSYLMIAFPQITYQGIFFNAYKLCHFLCDQLVSFAEFKLSVELLDCYMQTVASFSESEMRKNGKVTYEDFLAASKTLCIPVVETEADFQLLESFTDNAVSFNEAMLVLSRNKLLSEESKNLPDASDDLALALLSGERLKLLWNKSDDDKNGKVAKDAATGLVQKLLSLNGKEASALAELVYLLCATSNDDTVNVEEFSKLVHLSQAYLFTLGHLSFALQEEVQRGVTSFNLDDTLALFKKHFEKALGKTSDSASKSSFDTLVALQQKVFEGSRESSNLTPSSVVLFVALQLIEYSKTVELQPPAFHETEQASNSVSKSTIQISKEDAKKLFKQFDFNGNGILSLAEIDKAVSESFPGKFSKPTLIRAYKSADVSGDGFIQFKEFKKVLELLEEYQQLWEKFQAFDTNGDRRISFDEFERGYLQFSSKSLSKEALRREFMSFDSNNGGFILFDEFVMKVAARSLQAKRGTREKSKAIAKGKARKPSYSLFPAEYLQMLWLAGDYDGDENVTPAEMLRMVAVFFPKVFKNCAVDKLVTKDTDRKGFERLVHLCAFVEIFFDEDLFAGVSVVEGANASTKQISGDEFERVLTSLRLPATPENIDATFASLSEAEKTPKYISLDALMFYVADLVYSCLLESRPVGILQPIKLQVTQTGSALVAPPIPLGSGFDQKAVEQLFDDFDLSESGAIDLAELNHAVSTRNPEYGSEGRSAIVFRLLSMVRTPADHFISKDDFVFIFRMLDGYERLYQQLSQEVNVSTEINEKEYQRICTALHYAYSFDEYKYHTETKDTIDFDSLAFSLAVVRAIKEKWRTRDAIISDADMRSFKRVSENVWKTFDLQPEGKVRFGDFKAALCVLYEHLSEKVFTYALSMAGLSPAGLADDTLIDFKTFCTFLSFVETNEHITEFLVAKQFFPTQAITKENTQQLAALLGVNEDGIAVFENAETVVLKDIYPDITKAFMAQKNWFDFEKITKMSTVIKVERAPRASEASSSDDEQLLNLSPERLKEIWQVFDNNGNGIVSLAEIDRAMIIVFPKYASKKSVLLRAYKAADVSGDGYIQKKEFKMLFTLIVEYDHLHQKFSELDSNGDHRISFDEFMQGAKALGIEDETPQKLKSLFDEIDSNSGGKILFDEFVMFFAKKRVELTKQKKQATKKKATAQPQSKVVFKPVCSKINLTEQRLQELWCTFDYNGNGVLSLAEIDKAILVLFPKYFKHKRALMRAYKAADASGDSLIQKDEFKKLLEYIELYDNLWQMFEQVDKSGDNRLSLEEFEEHFESFKELIPNLMNQSPKEVFDSIDENKGGYILFDEFAFYFADKVVFEK